MPRSTTCTVADFCSLSLAACPSKLCSNTTGCTNQKQSICALVCRIGQTSQVDSCQRRHCGRPNGPCLFHPTHSNSNKHSTKARNAGTWSWLRRQIVQAGRTKFALVDTSQPKKLSQIQPKHLEVEHQLWIDQSESH